jgi:hypothetical protein
VIPLAVFLVRRCGVKTMSSLPQLSDLSSLVAALDRHPFGALASIVLAGIVLAVVLALRGKK